MKHFTKGILLLQIFWICACSATKQVENSKKQDITEFVGKKATFIGKTVNMKLGAVLVLENGQRIWMDEMSRWPNEYWDDKESKSVQVTGVLIERYDLPVFVPSTDDSIVLQGIPISKGIDLKKAGHRYVLKNYELNKIK